MERKLLTLILMLFFILGFTTVANATEEVEAQITYILNETQDGYIASECKNRSEIVNLIIPETYQGLPVTEIGDDFFNVEMVYSTLESITLPNTITKIGNNAFRGIVKLNAINLPESLIEIGSGAFKGCLALEKIDLPSKLEIIGNNAFGATTSLKEIVIPDSVTTLGAEVFLGSAITSASVGANVKVLNSRTFASCTNLEKVELKAVEEIGENVFEYDNNLWDFSLPDTLKKIGARAFYWAIRGHWIMGDQGYNVMDESKLPNIVIPESVTYIGDEAFNLNILKSMSLPNNLEYLGEGVFSGTDIKEIEIPANITVLPAKLFSGSTLEKITIKGIITEIGDYCFQFSNIRKIDLPEGLIKIGDYSFSHAGLGDIKFPATLEYIGNFAFYETSGLNFIEIPESVTYIGENAFGGYEHNAVNHLKSIAINSNNITRIEFATFANQISFRYIKIPETIEFIDENAFANCLSLASINIPSKVTMISSNTFTNCINLKTVNLPDGLKTINSGAFNQCISLETITIPASVTTIDASAFANCTNLTTIYGVKGSTAETFAKENNLKFIELGITIVETEEVKNEEGKTINAMPITKDNTVDSFINKENFPGLADGTNEAVIKDAEGNVKSASDGIGSKNVIQIVDKATREVIAEYTVVVRGDITGEGKARIFDAYEILKDSIIKTATDYPEIDIMIRDYDGDEKVRIFDAYSYLRDSIL